MKRPISDHSRALVQKLWSYCTVLRDDGMSYGDYVEQLTYLLFLKMAHERTQPPRNETSRIPAGHDWPSLLEKTGPELEVHYIEILRELAKQDGLLGLIFRKSQSKIQDPAKLRRLIVDLIDPETWTGIDADVKGDVYEGLLEKNAADLKSGAGQYFTPRALIKAIVDVMQPGPDMTVADPACGTGGFLLAAHDFIAEHHLLDRDQKKFLRDHALRGNEIVDNTARLCAMNLYLHGVGGATVDATPPVTVGDALLQEPAEKVDMVLANPPFGKRSSITMVGEDGRAANGVVIARQDFWATTSNKQLNFLQHIRSMLRIGGEAAVVLPDNVLFEGGAGATIRKRLLQECDLHTILRLPTGLFYAQGVRANVLFFTRRAPSGEPATTYVWVYDFRTNQRFTLKTRAMTRADLQPFVEAYMPGHRHERVESERFKRWSYEEVRGRDGFNLDVWASVKDASLTDASSLPAPDLIAAEIIEEVSAGLAEFAALAAELEGDDGAGDHRAAELDGVKALVEDVEL